MAALPDAPRKLPGSTRFLRWSVGGPPNTALWLNDRALIQTQLFLYKEGYRQFELTDIQALTLRRTNRGKIFNAVCLVVAVGLFIPSYEVSFWFAREVFAIVAAMPLVLAVINTARGATCRVDLQTAVGRRELPTLNRVRIAQQVIRTIAAAAVNAQGAAPAEEIAARLPG